MTTFVVLFICTTFRCGFDVSEGNLCRLNGVGAGNEVHVFADERNVVGKRGGEFKNPCKQSSEARGRGMTLIAEQI
jgi:hypothetical protein